MCFMERRGAGAGGSGGTRGEFLGEEGAQWDVIRQGECVHLETIIAFPW